MNGMIKSALRKTLKGAKLTYEELETVIIQIESVINSRPLSYIYDNDVVETLTPSHLMYGKRLLNRSNAVSVGALHPTKQIEFVEDLLATFWERFRNEYLLSLRERDRNCKSNEGIVVGDVVVIREPNSSRSVWPLGRVTKLICSSDGVTHGAVLKTKNGIIERSLKFLYPLELNSNVDAQEIGRNEETVSEIDNENIADTVETRPKRIAAKSAIKSIRRIHQDELDD